MRLEVGTFDSPRRTGGSGLCRSDLHGVPSGLLTTLLGVYAGILAFAKMVLEASQEVPRQITKKMLLGLGWMGAKGAPNSGRTTHVFRVS